MIFSRKRYSISDLPLIIHNLQQALSHTLYYRRQKHTMSSSQYYMYIFSANSHSNHIRELHFLQKQIDLIL